MAVAVTVGDGITLKPEQDGNRSAWIVTEGSNQTIVTPDDPAVYNLLVELYQKASE